MMEYWNDVKNRNKNKTPFKPNIPVFQHSSIPIGAKPLSSKQVPNLPSLIGDIKNVEQSQIGGKWKREIKERVIFT